MKLTFPEEVIHNTKCKTIIPRHFLTTKRIEIASTDVIEKFPLATWRDLKYLNRGRGFGTVDV